MSHPFSAPDMYQNYMNLDLCMKSMPANPGFRIFLYLSNKFMLIDRQVAT